MVLGHVLGLSLARERKFHAFREGSGCSGQRWRLVPSVRSLGFVLEHASACMVNVRQFSAVSGDQKDWAAVEDSRSERSGSFLNSFRVL